MSDVDDGGGQVGWLVTATWDTYCWDVAPTEADVRRLSGIGSSE